MGRIDEYTRRVYAEILYGFITRNYRRVARCISKLGTSRPTAMSRNLPAPYALWASRFSA